MNLYVFNPEHDLALAQDDKNFTAPHAGRLLRSDLGFIPSFWANNGDIVLVDNIECVHRSFCNYGKFEKQVKFVDSLTVQPLLEEVTRVVPWGWDICITEQLRRIGLRNELLPNNHLLSKYKSLSNRQTSVKVLGDLVRSINNKSIIGRSCYVTTLEELQQQVCNNDLSVIKAPWSGSGRGIRYVRHEMNNHQTNWAKNIISNQGGIVIEPYYNKVKDFAMEFFVDCREVRYVGLSLFETVHGVYTGSMIAPEQDKLRLLSSYFSPYLLDIVRNHILKALTDELLCNYFGPVGVDMMVIENPFNKNGETRNNLLHPMVEINLRQTMGHVALAISKNIGNMHQLMHIAYDGTHYHLNIDEM